MKRDMDLVREILLKLEGLPMTGRWHDIEIDGRSPDEIVYHVRIMHEGGLVEASDLTTLNQVDWRPKRITWEGQEFLDAARSEKVWNMAKEKVMSAVGTLTFEGMKTALAEVIKSMMG